MQKGILIRIIKDKKIQFMKKLFSINEKFDDYNKRIDYCIICITREQLIFLMKIIHQEY